MNYNTILASLLDGISLALKSGNSNVDAEQFNFLTDAINKSTIIPSYFDRENAIKYLDVSDTEFARLTYKGTKFHPVTTVIISRESTRNDKTRLFERNIGCS